MHNDTSNFHAEHRAPKYFRTDGYHYLRVGVRSMIRFKLFCSYHKMYTLHDIFLLTTIHRPNLHTSIKRNTLHKKEEKLNTLEHVFT